MKGLAKGLHCSIAIHLGGFRGELNGDLRLSSMTFLRVLCHLPDTFICSVPLHSPFRDELLKLREGQGLPSRVRK
jgi:hypothetical protein